MIMIEIRIFNAKCGIRFYRFIEKFSIQYKRKNSIVISRKRIQEIDILYFYEFKIFFYNSILIAHTQHSQNFYNSKIVCKYNNSI